MEELSLIAQEKKQTYSSFLPTTLEEKKILFNAINNADIRLNDIVNQRISIKDVYMEAYEKPDDTTGEMKKHYRTIIMDKDGKTYATGAYGVYNTLVKVFKVFGEPQTWEQPLDVQIIKQPIANGRQILALKVI